MDLIIQRISFASGTHEDREKNRNVQNYGLFVSMKSVAAGGLIASFSINSPHHTPHIILKAALEAYEQKIYFNG